MSYHLPSLSDLEWGLVYELVFNHRAAIKATDVLEKKRCERILSELYHCKKED